MPSVKKELNKLRTEMNDVDKGGPGHSYIERSQRRRTTSGEGLGKAAAPATLLSTSKCREDKQVAATGLIPSSSDPSKMAAQRRNRAANNRNVGGNDEEVQIWQQTQEELRDLVASVNAGSANISSILSQESHMAKNKTTMNAAEESTKLENLLRKGVRSSDDQKAAIDALIEKVGLLKALAEAKEKAKAAASNAGPSGSRVEKLMAASSRNSSRSGARDKERRGAPTASEDKDTKGKKVEADVKPAKDADSSKAEGDSDMYDFNGDGDSPPPNRSTTSPSQPRKAGSTAGSVVGRGSVPPSTRAGDRDTPAKGESVEPTSGPAIGTPGPSTSSTTTGKASKVVIVFVKGQDVAFKTKESTDWFLGKVTQVIGEGKSRRYKVKDEDPDQAPEDRTEFRLAANSMISVPAAGTDLPKLEKGKIVLALYPDSTTFYKAEVKGMEGAGLVKLLFEGDEGGTAESMDKKVERRFVVDVRD